MILLFNALGFYLYIVLIFIYSITWSSQSNLWFISLPSGKGGKIVFGVSAGSKVVGVKAVRDDRDEFRLGVDRMMTDKLSPPVLHSLFDVVYHKVLNDDLDPVPDMFVISRFFFIKFMLIICCFFFVHFHS